MAEVEAAVYPNAILTNGHVILRVDGPLAGLGNVFGCFRLLESQRGVRGATASWRTLMAMFETAVVSLGGPTVRGRSWPVVAASPARPSTARGAARGSQPSLRDQGPRPRSRENDATKPQLRPLSPAALRAASGARAWPRQAGPIVPPTPCLRPCFAVVLQRLAARCRRARPLSRPPGTRLLGQPVPALNSALTRHRCDSPGATA